MPRQPVQEDKCLPFAHSNSEQLTDASWILSLIQAWPSWNAGRMYGYWTDTLHIKKASTVIMTASNRLGFYLGIWRRQTGLKNPVKDIPGTSHIANRIFGYSNFDWLKCTQGLSPLQRLRSICTATVHSQWTKVVILTSPVGFFSSQFTRCHGSFFLQHKSLQHPRSSVVIALPAAEVALPAPEAWP